MILPISFLVGFALGWWRAARRGGNRLDKLQYGAGHGIALLLLVLVLTILADRLGLV